MGHNEKVAATRKDMETLQAEQKRLLGLVSASQSDLLLNERLRAVTRMLRVLEDKLLELEPQSGQLEGIRN